MWTEGKSFIALKFELKFDTEVRSIGCLARDLHDSTMGWWVTTLQNSHRPILDLDLEGGPKKWTQNALHITLSNIRRF